MKIDKKVLLVISIIAIFSFLFLFVSTMLRPPHIPENETEGKFRPIPVHELWLSPLLLMIGLVFASYYVITRKIEDNMKVLAKLISKSDGNSNKKPIKLTDQKDIVLKFLNLNERKVIEKIIDEGGSTLQSDINRMEGMTKLKTHRAVKDLKNKGIIKIESYGKTNRIILTKDIKGILLR